METSKDQVRVMAALKQGNEAQKLLQKAIALEDIEKLMDETAEAREYQEQLKQILGESWTGEDEAAAQEEMAGMEAALAAEEAAALPEVPVQPTKVVGVQEEEELPSVPLHEPVVAQQQKPAAVVPRQEERGLVPAS